MTLTTEQKQTVSSWVEAGDNLSAVQRKLAEQFKISMTYMDVRFLVDDLGLELKNAAPKIDASDLSKSASAKPGGGASPSPRVPAPPPAKKGFIDKLKEKVGVGSGDDEGEFPAADMADAADASPAPPAPGGVTVELDRIVRPGAVVSGTVTFSDGVTGKWALDQAGRLMLDTSTPGYKPTPVDVQDFQRELSMQLQRHGF
ncbi:MAG: hypothetical protein HY302_04575 [Opitutae bacterium]|nr:hypothetical protein [Opitutae bacterium]